MAERPRWGPPNANQEPEDQNTAGAKPAAPRPLPPPREDVKPNARPATPLPKPDAPGASAPASPPARPLQPRPTPGADSPSPSGSLASPNARRKGYQAGAEPSALTGSLAANKAQLAKDAAGAVKPGDKAARKGSRKKAAKRAAVLAARSGAAAYTGGTSEKVLRGVDQAKPYIKKAIYVFPTLALAFLLFVIGIIFIVGGTTGNVNYALGSQSADQIPASYLAAYQAAGTQYNIPWTLLAGIGKVATDQGRTAPTDITDYHAIVDRNPSAATTLGDTTVVGSSSPAGSDENGPASDSSLAVVGDTLDPGLSSSLSSFLNSSSVAVTAQTDPTANLDSTAPFVSSALAAKDSTVVVSAGFNDLAPLASVSMATQRSTLSAAINKVVSASTGASCVVWANMPTNFTGPAAALNAPAKQFNQLLAAAATNHAWITVADWNNATATTSGLLTGSGTLTANGQALFTSLIQTTVGTCHTTGGKVAGTASSVNVKTSPNYTICASPDCTVVPAMGIEASEPKGPLSLDAAWLSANEGNNNPQSIIDSSNMLASALSTIRNTLVSSNQNAYGNYQTSPSVAASLWAAVLAQAPVDLPDSAQIDPTACAAEATATYTIAGTTFAWPFATTTLPPLNETYSSNHPEMDFGLQSGTAVLAATPGTLTSGTSKALGTYATVTSGGISSTYGHLSSVVAKSGTSVTVGEKIAISGDSGDASGPVLSFSMSNAQGPFNPTQALGAYGGPGRKPTDGTGVTTGSGTTSSTSSPTTPINPCTGTALTSSTVETYQQTVSANGCPTDAPPNTLYGGAVNIYQICAASVKAAPTPQAADAIIAALVHLGIPYSESIPQRSGPNFYDCSSFVTTMYDFAGVDLAPAGVNPPTTTTIATAGWGIHIPISAAQPGDLLEYSDLDPSQPGIDHVVMKLADGFIVQESGVGTQPSNVSAYFGSPTLAIQVDPTKVNAPPLTLNLTPGTSSAGEAPPATGPIAEVLSYAVYYGGLVPNDPAAGTFSGISSTAPSTSSVGALITAVWPAAVAQDALAVAGCESGLRPDAVNHNTNNTDDIGIFQLNTGGTLQGLLTRMGDPPSDIAMAYNASFNVQAGYLLYQERGFEPWYSSESCWNPKGTISLNPPSAATT